MKLRINLPVDVTTFATFANAITQAHPLWKDVRLIPTGGYFWIELPTLPIDGNEDCS